MSTEEEEKHNMIITLPCLQKHQNKIKNKQKRNVILITNKQAKNNNV